jgi:hypothetical protein
MCCLLNAYPNLLGTKAFMSFCYLPIVIVTCSCVLQVSLENGMVQAFDTRTASSNSNPGQPTFTLHAHNKAVSALSFCPSKPNVCFNLYTSMVKVKERCGHLKLNY